MKTIIAQSEIGNKIVYLFHLTDCYSVRCVGYKSKHYKSPFRSVYDYSKESYTLLRGDFNICLDLFIEESNYIWRLYRDGLQSPFLREE